MYLYNMFYMYIKLCFRRPSLFSRSFGFTSKWKGSYIESTNQDKMGMAQNKKYFKTNSG